MDTPDRFHFCTRRTVEFADTDMAGIVYFTHFLRYAATAEQEWLRSLGVRFLAPADADLRAEGVRFVADGDRPEVRRLTATFARGVPDRGMLLGLDLELLEGCDDAAFGAFRREFAGRSVRLEREGRAAAVRGALPVALDLGTGDERPRRLEFHPVLPEGALLLLDGDEIGRAAFEPDEPR